MVGIRQLAQLQPSLWYAPLLRAAVRVRTAQALQLQVKPWQREQLQLAGCAAEVVLVVAHCAHEQLGPWHLLQPHPAGWALAGMADIRPEQVWQEHAAPWLLLHAVQMQATLWRAQVAQAQPSLCPTGVEARVIGWHWAHPHPGRWPCTASKSAGATQRVDKHLSVSVREAKRE